jgi:hypothetical protein
VPEERPEPGELLEELRREVDEWRSGVAAGRSVRDAYLAARAAASNRDSATWDAAGDDVIPARYGHDADLILFWITGGWMDLEAVETASSVIRGGHDDPTTAKVLRFIERYCAGELAEGAFYRTIKKPLVPRPKSPAPPASTDAVLVSEARADLEQTIERARKASDGTADLSVAWQAFVDFVAEDIRVEAPYSIAEEAWLFQWGTYERDQGPEFELAFTRRMVIHDGDDDYDHLKQTHLLLTFDGHNQILVEAGRGERLGTSTLGTWIEEVESSAGFQAAEEHRPLAASVEHEDA